MNRLGWTGWLVFAAWNAVAAVASAAPAAHAAGARWAFVDVTVVPMTTRATMSGQTVLIQDGRIVAVGAVDATSTDGYAVIEGQGRWLMPGLAEMHAHVPPQPDAVQATLDVLLLYLANGITLARSMLGAPHHLALREQIARGDLIAPRLLTSGPSLNGNSVTSPETGRALVAAQHAAGYDFLKIHPGLDQARFEAVADAARRLGMPFAGHVGEAVGVRAAFSAGQATIDHLDQYLPALLRDGSPLAGTSGQFFGWNLADEVDEAKILELAAATRAAGVWNVPTQSLIEQLLLAERSAEALLARPEMRYVAAATARQWAEAKANVLANPAYRPELAARFVAVRRALIRALHDAGAGLLLGSDAPQIFNVPGFSIHEELRLLVAAGLAPYEALRTGTVNVAAFLGAPDDFGQVATGHRADLILLEADPLVDVANVERRVGVMVGGHWLPAATLDERLNELASRLAAADGR
ncbi:MAG: amidohydrolase family protein [Pseudomonadales bacterium]|nr:amidohydrolase family protein [Pseudomonadales bacterium]